MTKKPKRQSGGKRGFPKKENTAHHEAGHAVAAIMLDLPFDYVSIGRGRDDQGEPYLGAICHPSLLMMPGRNSFRARVRNVRNAVMVAYAGIEAELCFDPNADERLAQDDFDNAENFLSADGLFPRYPDEASAVRMEQILNRLRREARRLVRKHWALVETLAKALLKRKRLGYDEARSVLEMED
jgi:ATP-dependent Zn protease